MQDLIKLGVTSYHAHVAYFHTLYFGTNNYRVQSDPKYAPLNIADKSNNTKFINDLKSHQQGNTDYSTFCNDCAKSGVEKWIVDTSKMTCAYYDKSGNEMLVENVPTP